MPFFFVVGAAIVVPLGEDAETRNALIFTRQLCVSKRCTEQVVHARSKEKGFVGGCCRHADIVSFA